MPGFRQNEFFEPDFDPGKAEAAAGGPGKIRGEPSGSWRRVWRP